MECHICKLDKPSFRQLILVDEKGALLSRADVCDTCFPLGWNPAITQTGIVTAAKSS